MGYKVGDEVYFRYGTANVYGKIIEDTTSRFGDLTRPCFTIETWFVHEDGSVGGKFVKATWVDESELYPSFEKFVAHENEIYNEEINECYEEYRGDGSLENLLNIPFRIFNDYIGSENLPEIDAYKKLVNEYLEEYKKEND